jgi:hypothetical protein
VQKKKKNCSFFLKKNWGIKQAKAGLSKARIKPQKQRKPTIK